MFIYTYTTTSMFIFQREKVLVLFVESGRGGCSLVAVRMWGISIQYVPLQRGIATSSCTMLAMRCESYLTKHEK